MSDFEISSVIVSIAVVCGAGVDTAALAKENSSECPGTTRSRVDALMKFLQDRSIQTGQPALSRF